MKGGFNLSRWALEHIPLTRYLMAVLLIGGMLSYASLGQDEDPPFTSVPWCCKPTGRAPRPCRWPSR